MIKLNDFKMAVSKLATIIMVLLTLSISFSVNAKSINSSLHWQTGINTDQPAGTCIQNIPDNRPLAVPKTLIVNKNLPVGAEIYSWGYGDFLPDFSMSCTITGTNDTTSIVTSYGRSIRLAVTPMMTLISGSTYATNVAGVGIILYYKFDQPSIFCSSSCYRDNNVIQSNSKGPAVQEWVFVPSDNYIGLRIHATQHKDGSFGPDLEHNPLVGSFSIRAALVKTGDIDYDKSINLASIGSFLNEMTNNYDERSDLLDGNGIRFMPPTCQLQTKDYKVDMPIWENNDPKGSVIVGNPEPVNIALECSRKADNVRFKFEDTGANKLSSKNISLYESIGGGVNPINGLEIEMLYNGAHVDVDNTSTTNIGEQEGSLNIVKFSARYIQRNNITTQYNNLYAGPVTGKVNMWVIYD